MPEFIVRVHNAPVTPSRFLAAQGVEYLAQMVVNALFVSQGHRADAALTLVLEKSDDFSRALTLRGDALGSLASLHEAGILAALGESLGAAEGLGKEACITDGQGIQVQAISFERLLKARLESCPCYLLDPSGQDIRGTALAPESVFVMTDQVPMQKKIRRSLVRQGCMPLSLGPRMLHASQCMTLVHNELDRA